MSTTSKKMSDLNFENVLRQAHNPNDGTIATGSFVSSKVGHKITRSDINATTEDYSFHDGSTLLYTLRIIYTDGTRSSISSVERTV